MFKDALFPPGREVNGLPLPKAKPANPGSLPFHQPRMLQEVTTCCHLPYSGPPEARRIPKSNTPPHISQSIEPLYGPAR